MSGRKEDRYISGTKEGALKAQATILKRYGKEHYANMGKIGGKARVPKGFALDRDRAREAGRLGGSRGKRGKKLSTGK